MVQPTAAPVNLKSYTVQQLIEHLKVRGYSTPGRKDMLIRGLEGVLSAEN